jgi:TrmH family RNA methyltransferase
MNMLSINQTKHIRSLQLGKYRKIHNQFIAEGPKLFTSIVHSRFSIVHVYGLNDWIENHQSNLKYNKIPFSIVSEKELRKISNQGSPNQVLCVVKIPKTIDWDINDYTGFTLVLDEIKDPGNMGTIIRTADWFGIDRIICSSDCVDIYNPKVVQSTMGSIANVRITSCKLTDYFKNCNNAGIYGAAMEGEPVYTIQPEKNSILVIGNESHGLSKTLKPFISKYLTIPPFTKAGNIPPESLNASVATAIICSEFAKKMPH